MKVFTTKNWQTAGIQEVEGQVDRNGFWGRIESPKYDRKQYIGKNSWHRTYEEAQSAAMAKRDSRVVALEKQIAALQAKVF